MYTTMDTEQSQNHRTATALTMTTTTTTTTATTTARHTSTFEWHTPTSSSCRCFLTDSNGEMSCEKQLHKGWSILKDRDVPHAQALPRILKGNGVDVLKPSCKCPSHGVVRRKHVTHARERHLPASNFARPEAVGHVLLVYSQTSAGAAI